jgi:uncharacterized protein (TIGR00730 family)
MGDKIDKVAVFCGSATGNDVAISRDCLNLAAALCTHEITLVYGGGNVGLMGILADEMLRLGGKVVGVIPEKLVQIEVAHSNLTRLHIVKGMHERKALMTSLADAFIVLPGGIGTMEEFFEIYTWLQLGYHNKPIAISNTNGFYDILLSMLNHMVEQEFVKRSQIDRLIISGDAVDALNCLINFKSHFSR